MFPFFIPMPVGGDCSTTASESQESREYHREKTQEIRERRERRKAAEKKAIRDAEAAAKKIVDDARIARWEAAIEPIIAADETITLE